MPRATGAAGHEGAGRSPTQEELDDVVAKAESFTREAAESEQSPTQGELDGVVAEAEQITAEAAAEYEGVEPGQESAEDAAEVQASETLRTDAEILGNRYPVSQMIKGAGNTLQWGKERAAAAWNNAMEQPGLLMDKFMHGLAQSSYDRRKAKLDKVAHLGDNHPLKKFRMRKLQKAEARLNKRKANLEIRQNRMTGRVEAVKNAYEARREATIAELSKRRDEALARKETRRKLREQGAGWLEARRAAKEHANSIPEDQRRYIASILLNAVEANKKSQEASWQARYAERVSADAQNRVEMLGQELGQTRVDLENTRQQAGEIADMEANLVTVKENVAKLREKAESLSDDSANKFAVMNELVEAENQQAEMEQTITNHHQRLTDLWQRQGQLSQELHQAKVNAENAAKELENRAQAEAAAKKKAEATQQARDRSVENTFV